MTRFNCETREILDSVKERMDSIFDKITQAINDFLMSIIESNLSTMFDDVNDNTPIVWSILCKELSNLGISQCISMYLDLAELYIPCKKSSSEVSSI